MINLKRRNAAAQKNTWTHKCRRSKLTLAAKGEPINADYLQPNGHFYILQFIAP